MKIPISRTNAVLAGTWETESVILIWLLSVSVRMPWVITPSGGPGFRGFGAETRSRAGRPRRSALFLKVHAFPLLLGLGHLPLVDIGGTSRAALNDSDAVGVHQLLKGLANRIDWLLSL